MFLINAKGIKVHNFFNFLHIATHSHIFILIIGLGENRKDDGWDGETRTKGKASEK